MAKSFFQLNAQEIATINERAKGTIRTQIETWGIKQIGEALGIRVIPEDDVATPALFSHKKVRYTADNNKTNRPLSMPNMRNLLSLMLRGMWACNGEVLIIDDTGMLASAQHRLVAAYIACLENPTLQFTFVVVRGVPAEFVDSIDTGKSRDNKDASARHEDILPIASLSNLQGFGYGKKAGDVRKTLLTELNSVCRLVQLRGTGKDVKASSTGYKQTEYFAQLERMGKDVETLVSLVYAYDTAENGSKGALAKYIGRNHVGAALVLYSNQSNPPKVVLEGENKKHYTLPDSIAIDLEFARDFLYCASQRNGFMAKLYNYLEENTSAKQKFEAPYKMGALVKAIQWFAEHRTTRQLPPEIHPETGEVIADGKTVPDCPQLAGHGIPKAPGVNSATGKPNPFNWPAFGGLDVGYSAKSELTVEDMLAN